MNEIAGTVSFSLNRNTTEYTATSDDLITYAANQQVDWKSSKDDIHTWLANVPEAAVPIVLVKSLDRAGDAGEMVAANLCRMLGAKQLTILTQSPGIWSARPDLVQDAMLVPHLSLQEAAELAYPNSGILHPKSLVPLKDLDLTIQIRPIDDLNAAGSTVSAASPESDKLAKGITVHENLALIVIDGLGMMGVPGVSAQAFSTLAAQSINIVLLSQASTEHSIGIVIDQAQKEAALDLLQDAFMDRLADGQISQIYALDAVGIVTVVDDWMRFRPGLTGKMFSTLGRSGINVLTIADGASESNISAVVAGTDTQAAVHALHEAFCHSRRVAHVFMFGTGTIGGQLLKLMAQQSDFWLEHLNLKICLVGVSNSRKVIWDKSGIDFESAQDLLSNSEQPLDVDTVYDHLIHSRLDRLIVIDATASDQIANIYPGLLEHNIAIVTPNKKPNTQSTAHYDRLLAAARDHQVPYFYETTVGAGLPVISTLRDLIRSGDSILRIEGVVSGTLSYLFSSMGAGKSLAEALQQAYDLGYTEPDPRDDLSGEDVARKMLILAREAGLKVERSNIKIRPLLSDELMQMSRDAFMASFKELLSDWQPDIKLASGQKAHYVGSIVDGNIEIGPRAVDADSPLASLHGTDNMIIFTTRRYFETPLVIRGPGAGPAVTAGGVLADLIKAAELVT